MNEKSLRHRRDTGFGGQPAEHRELLIAGEDGTQQQFSEFARLRVRPGQKAQAVSGSLNLRWLQKAEKRFSITSCDNFLNHVR
jgi:hypothetical protein